MNNQEAIGILKIYKRDKNNNSEVFDLAIKALEEVEELKEENHRNFVNSQHIISSLIEEIKKLRNEKG